MFSSRSFLDRNLVRQPVLFRFVNIRKSIDNSSMKHLLGYKNRLDGWSFNSKSIYAKLLRVYPQLAGAGRSGQLLVLLLEARFF